MDYSRLNKIIAAVVTAISVIVLIMTVQPSVSFWDCGEFIAASFAMQVPHPPGAPFFLIVGRIFSMIPFVENIALRVNYVSVLASGFSITFLYLTIVKMIENYRGKEYKSTLDALGTFLAAAIGALSFSFSDTFWFNGVEAEVYASSTFLFAIIAYLMMLWNEKADNPDNEKYILMIAYLVGLSTGVHLMSVLAILSVVMVIMFRKYVSDDAHLKNSGYIFLGHVAIVLVIAFAMWAGETLASAPSAEEYGSFDGKFKGIMLVVSLAVMGAFWKKLFNRNSIYMPFIFGGIALAATYPGVVKVLPSILKSLSGDNSMTALFILVLLLAGLGFVVYYATRENKPTLHLVSLSAIFIILGFTTYAMVIVRANADPPMNENEPNDFSELVSYLNREQYGDFPTFKRRFSQEPHQTGVYTNYSSDLEFWWKYQMNHMMTRYWMWNYVGRESWNQDSGVNAYPFNAVGNAIIKPLFNINFAGESKDSLFGIPFLLGLLGIFFQYRKDWKMASIFMVTFIFMGYLTAFYQNQQQPQPRERDYFYVGAFFIFSAWIGFGVRGLIDFIHEKMKSESLKPGIVFGVLAFGVIFVPGRMLQANYHTHDRSKSYIPWDYSYNLLQSCAPNAILFTNGDNDTFPLWYLQDVEKVRTDVRIVNLSLVNTNWYIKQLKNLEPHGSKKVNMRFSDEEIDQLRPVQFAKKTLSVSVPDWVYKQFGITDTSITNQKKITWTMNPTLNYQNVQGIRVQDILVQEIVEQFGWQRPVYFAVTCSDDSKIGLTDYLQMEGMAHRLVPKRATPNIEYVNERIMRKQLFDDSNEFSKSYRPGLKFRGLNKGEVFLDDNHERLTQNYRNSFIRLAVYYLNTKQYKKVREALDRMETVLPRQFIPFDYRIMFDVANVYWEANGKKQYEELMVEVEKEAVKRLATNPDDFQNYYYSPYRILTNIYERRKEYDKAIEIMKKLQIRVPNDPSVQAQIQQYMDMKAGKNKIETTPRPEVEDSIVVEPPVASDTIPEMK